MTTDLAAIGSASGKAATASEPALVDESLDDRAAVEVVQRRSETIVCDSGTPPTLAR